MSNGNRNCVACGASIDVARREPVCDGCMPTPGIYRHMKGGLYTVLGLATEEATGTTVVVYQGAGGVWWARQLTAFVQVVMYNGSLVSRFRRVSP